ncbi:hypothetical protein Tco_1299371 [Tanacetum coccineum]
MSVSSNANTSMFPFNRSFSWDLHVSDNPPPMTNNWSGNVGFTRTSSVTLTSSVLASSFLISSETSSSITCFFSKRLHSEKIMDRVTRVAIPFGVGNFIIEWMVEGMARNVFIQFLPRITLYGDGSLMMVNFMVVLLHNPSFPKHTSNSILPNGFVTSLAKPTRSV